ncbi:redoxin domain-containing protein [Bacillus licheniformis]|nr:redoxin domain-containing protein [Bacillus licheniformis]
METMYLCQTLKGKSAVKFWATWCRPCETEMPAMEELQMKSGHCRLAVNFTSSEKTKDGQSVCRKARFTFPHRLRPNGHQCEIRDFSYPTTFIIDENGIIKDIVLGTMSKRIWKKAGLIKYRCFAYIRQNGEMKQAGGDST